MVIGIDVRLVAAAGVDVAGPVTPVYCPLVDRILTGIGDGPKVSV